MQRYKTLPNTLIFTDMRHPYILLALLLTACSQQGGLCPDTHLELNFPDTPAAPASGMIRVRELRTGKVVDSLDLSIPAGPAAPRSYGPDCDYAKVPYDYSPRSIIPTNRDTRPGTPSGTAIADTSVYQLNIIGGFTDGFHFHPVLIRGQKAVIYFHNNVLDYGRRYRVEIDDEVFGTHIDSKTFRTRRHGPRDVHDLRVAADGSGDFCTLQGALDAVADADTVKTVITLAPGDYEEIVYARCKTNLEIRGAGKDLTRIHYANNEVFNPHPLNVKNNEREGAFPYRRAAVALDHCNDVTISGLTVATDLKGQAEGLLINGERVALYDVRIIGDGDALQANGSIYLENCEIDGGGDTILGRGSVYMYRCALRNGGGPFSWVRNFKPAHGDVLVECTLESTSDYHADYGRSRLNHGTTYPDAEFVVIDCAVRNFLPQGWSELDEPSALMLEYHTRSMDSGELVDVSQRHPISRQLDEVRDSALIASYRNPAFVLGGWNPVQSR